MSTSNSKIFSKINLARAKSKAIENRAAADGQTAIVGAWGRASASRNPLVPWKGDGGDFAHLYYRCIACYYSFRPLQLENRFVTRLLFKLQ